MTKLHQFADFKDKNIFVGMDVHLKSWNISLFFEQQYLRTFSQPPSPEGLEKFLRHEFPGATYLCGYESGYCGFWIQRRLQQQGINCMVIHAADIPQTNKHKTNKTDSIDSKSIGLSMATGMVNAIHVPDLVIEGDRSLIRLRSRIQRDIGRCKTRIRSLFHQFGFEFPDKFGKCWSNKFIQWLKEFDQAPGTVRITLNHMIGQMEVLRGTLLRVNRDIRVLQKSDGYKQKMALLMSIPGIGPLTAITLLTEIGDLLRFKSFRQFNSFVGLYPMEFSSGEHEYKGNITFRHNSHLRNLMIEAAWTAIKHDPAMLLVFDDWKKRMTAKRAIVKVARKLLSRIRHVWMNETSYVKGIVK
jgi:transposase